MATNLTKYGQWAMVAGGASGLGYAFCQELAEQSFNLIVVDNDQKALNQSSIDLAAQFKVEVRTLFCDLSSIQSVDLVTRELELKKCRLLIYNAAYGPVKRFTSNTREELDTYVSLNCQTPLHLAHGFATLHVDGDPAAMLLMSSQAGLRGTSLVAPYAATKAFDWNLAEALSYEYAKTNLDFLAVCPGAIDTPNFRKTNPRQVAFTPAPRNPQFVAKAALTRIGKDRLYIPGFLDRTANFVLSRLLPRRWAGNIVNRTIVKMYAKSIE